jgi:hypothetical protein
VVRQGHRRPGAGSWWECAADLAVASADESDQHQYQEQREEPDRQMGGHHDDDPDHRNGDEYPDECSHGSGCYPARDVLNRASRDRLATRSRLVTAQMSAVTLAEIVGAKIDPLRHLLRQPPRLRARRLGVDTRRSGRRSRSERSRDRRRPRRTRRAADAAHRNPRPIVVYGGTASTQSYCPERGHTHAFWDAQPRRPPGSGVREAPEKTGPAPPLRRPLASANARRSPSSWSSEKSATGVEPLVALR